MPASLFDIQFGVNIHPWEDESLVASLKRITGMGYNGVEVTNRTYRNYSDRVFILKEIVNDIGIQVISYVLKMDFTLLSMDSALLNRFERLAGFIRKVGGRYVIVEQGIEARWNADLGEQLAHFERVLTDFAGICTDNGVELVYHPTPDSFILSSEIMDRVVETIYPLGTRICFDVCDFLQLGIHPIQFMKKYFDAISVIHLNDMRITKGKHAHCFNEPDHKILGQGKVDLDSIWTFLQAMEFKG
ncbi:MAG: sugar phosphate isomerase/epimerase [Planctomycetes bacterium]|nr:sugar phosphate isomerase/epimerase [Planctomycetota bacterium]